MQPIDESAFFWRNIVFDGRGKPSDALLPQGCIIDYSTDTPYVFFQRTKRGFPISNVSSPVMDGDSPFVIPALANMKGMVLGIMDPVPIFSYEQMQEANEKSNPKRYIGRNAKLSFVNYPEERATIVCIPRKYMTVASRDSMKAIDDLVAAFLGTKFGIIGGPGTEDGTMVLYNTEFGNLYTIRVPDMPYRYDLNIRIEGFDHIPVNVGVGNDAEINTLFTDEFPAPDQEMTPYSLLSYLKGMGCEWVSDNRVIKPLRNVEGTGDNLYERKKSFWSTAPRNPIYNQEIIVDYKPIDEKSEFVRVPADKWIDRSRMSGYKRDFDIEDVIKELTESTRTRKFQTSGQEISSPQITDMDRYASSERGYVSINPERQRRIERIAAKEAVQRRREEEKPKGSSEWADLERKNEVDGW